MKKHSKIIALLISAILLVGIVAITAFAETVPETIPDASIPEGTGAILKHEGEADQYLAFKAGDVIDDFVKNTKPGDIIQLLVDAKTDVGFGNGKDVTIDLNNNTLDLTRRIYLSEKTNLVIKNGTVLCKNIKDKNGELSSLEKGTKDKILTFDNCTINLKTTICDMRDGTIVVNNSTINAPGNRFLSAAYRGTNMSLDISNSTVNFTKSAVNLIDCGRATDGKDNAGYKLDANFNDVTFTGKIDKVVKSTNFTVGGQKTTINVTFEDSCVFDQLNNELIYEKNIGTINITSKDICRVDFYDGDTLIDYSYYKKGAVPSINACIVDNGVTKTVNTWSTDKNAESGTTIGAINSNTVYYAKEKVNAIFSVTDSKGFGKKAFADSNLQNVINKTENNGIITLHKNISVDSINIKKPLVIDLNDNSLSMNPSKKRISISLGSNKGNVTFKNGTLNAPSDANLIYITETNANTFINLDNCKIICQKWNPIEFRTGTLNITNCKAYYNLKQGEEGTFISLSARGQEKKCDLNIENSVVENSGKGTYRLISYSRAKDGNDVKNGINMVVNLRNLQTTGNMRVLLTGSNGTDATKCSITFNVDKNCKFAGECIIQANSIKNKIEIENGAEFENLPNIIGDSNATVGTQGSIVIPISDGIYNYKVLPRLIEGNVYVNIDSDVNLIYVLEATTANPKVIFTLATENGKIVQEVAGVKVGENLYSFKFTNIDPRYFGDTISVQFKDGEAVNATISSVKEYCVKVLQKYGSTDDPELKVLVSDILRYGAAAQNLKGYKTDALVNENLPTDVTLAERADVVINESIRAINGTENADFMINSIAMRLEGDTKLLLTIHATDIANLKVRFTINGRVVEVSDFKDLTNNNYTVVFDYVMAYEFADSIKIELVNNNEVVGKTVTYSVNSYIYDLTQTSTDENEKALLQCIANYGDSALKYKNR